ncbi:MAG: HAMP domain-containing sensor histidine kinase [Verrucomicrobiota bacterium]
MRGLIHKHNNILTITQGYANLLINAESLEEARQNAAIIAKSSEKAAELNARVIACASSDEPHPRAFALESFLDSTRKLARETALRHNLTFEDKSPPSSLQLDTDSDWLTEILTELIQNAAEAPGVTTFQLLCQPADGHITISIKDNGSGIPDDILPHIFRPFYTTKGREHLGIGLTRSARFADKLTGRISFESSENGTTASLQIPITP